MDNGRVIDALLHKLILFYFSNDWLIHMTWSESTVNTEKAEFMLVRRTEERFFFFTLRRIFFIFFFLSWVTWGTRIHKNRFLTLGWDRVYTKTLFSPMTSPKEGNLRLWGCVNIGVYNNAPSPPPHRPPRPHKYGSRDEGWANHTHVRYPYDLKDLTTLFSRRHTLPDA